MIVFNDPRHGADLARLSGCRFDPSEDSVISRTNNDGLLGGVIYKQYTRASIRMHVSSFTPRWGNRDMLWVCFHYPFVQLGCRLVLGEIPSSNQKALEFDYKLGFNYITTVPNVYEDGHLIVLGMKREECRWLQLKPRGVESRVYGRQDFSAAAA